MATLLNDRNSLLYTASSRVTGASVSISPGAATTLVVPKGASAPVPTSVILTASVLGYITPAYVWSYRFGDTGSFTVLAGTNNPLTVTTDAAFLTAAGANTLVQYKVAVSETTSNIGINQSEYTLTIPILREGVDGVVGLNSATISLYKRTATNVAPTVDTAGNAVYTFSSSQVVGQPSGWSQSIPDVTGGAYLWNIQMFVAATTISYSFSNTLWSSPILYAQDGSIGTNGLNTALIYAYKRSATLPTDNPGAVDYSFSSNTITTNPLANSWLKTIPSGLDPLYVTVATASSISASDSIPSNEWTTPVILSQNGINSASVFLYARNNSSLTAPSLVTTGTSIYEFSTAVLSGTIPTGWTQTLPDASNGSVLWAVQVTAASASSTDSILNTEWGTPKIIAQNGTAGNNGTRGSRQLFSNDPLYSSTYTYLSNPAGAVSYEVKATDLIAAATVGSTPLTPIDGDTVTFTNNISYVYTITYNGSTSAWVPPGTVIDGSLLVTGSVTAAKIDSRGLTIRAPDGTVILSAGVPLDVEYIPELSSLSGTISSNQFNDDYLILNADNTDIDAELRFGRTTGGTASITWNGTLVQSSKPFMSQQLGFNNISVTEPSSPFAKQIWIDPLGDTASNIIDGGIF